MFSAIERTLIAVSSFVSVLGSTTIIYRFLKCRNCWNKTYERLVLGLSVSDVVFSATLSFAPILVYPASEPSALCTFEAFFKHFGFAGPYYNAALSYYYLLVIVFRVNDKTIARYYEPMLHLFAIPLALVACVACLLLEVYNPSPASETCWILPYPSDCVVDDDDNNNAVVPACIRGEPQVALVLRLVGMYVPLLIVLASLIVNNVWIFMYVRGVERQVQRHTTTTIATRTASSSTHHASQVAGQSFCFVFAFFLSFLPSALLEIVDWLDDSENIGRYYALQLVRAVLYPMQGLFNVLVYIRPRYLRWRRWSAAGESRWTCFYHALFTFQHAPTRTTERQRTRRWEGTTKDPARGESLTGDTGGPQQNDDGVVEEAYDECSVSEPGFRIPEEQVGANE